MSLLAPTFPQIRALVTAIRKKHREASVIGIRAGSRWTGAARVEEQDGVYLVRQCDSPLEMRVALREETEAGAIRVVVTSLTEADLGEDLLLRLVRRKLFPVDPWQIVRSLFQAQSIDPRLTRHHWLAERLLEALPPDECRPAPGGFLDAETIWSLLLGHSIGLTARRPDLNTLLKWSLNAGDVARLRALPAEFQEAAVTWLADLAGNGARQTLRCAIVNDRPDALPVALAAGSIFHPEADGRLERARGRLEERYLGGMAPDEEAMRRLNAAAAEVVQRQLPEPVAAQALQRADEILREVGAEAFAYLSDTSPLGFDKRMAMLGENIDQVLAGGYAPGLLDAVRAVRNSVRAHDIARRQPRRLETIDMAVRLNEWLARARQSPPPAPVSFAAACAHQVTEGSFVDWARLTLRVGDPVRELSDAFTRLTRAAGEIRETQAREFAHLLRDWTAAGSSGTGVMPVERVLADVVAPLAAEMPVLLIVMDGMSVAVARELLADIIGQDWTALRRDDWASALAPALAAIPSVTEASRASLLCGQLCRGASDVERNGFARHSALLRHCRPGHPPILFHKALLQEQPGANLSEEVREAIAAVNNRIVGVVINAVDDQLLKGDQMATRWTRDEIKALPALLHEARSAGRVVVLLSDHGHILESGTEAMPRESGERWRPDDGAPAAEELQIRGSRVVLPTDHTLIAPWSERVRYGGRKNGYHGGLNPQEMVVPIVVLCGTAVYPDGWSEAVSDTPSWWVDPFLTARPRNVISAAPAISRRTALPLTLELDVEGNAQQDEGQAGAGGPYWVTQLLASALFTEQWTLPGRTPPDRERFTQLLTILDSYGGILSASTLGQQLNCPPSRLNALLSASQRILNIDGYVILTRDPIADTVQLNRELLWQQFDLV